MKQFYLFFAILTIFAALVTVPNAVADTYTVDRLFTDGSDIATLVGTLDIPQGNYTIMNEGPSPFTAVDLTLTVNGTSFALIYALTGIIRNNGQFFINATPTELIFNTANWDGQNPADLVFSDNLNPYAINRYVIGSNANPNFEVAYTSVGDGSVVASVDFPVVFGIAAVPEPSTMILLGSGLIGLWGLRKKFKK